VRQVTAKAGRLGARGRKRLILTQLASMSWPMFAMRCEPQRRILDIGRDGERSGQLSHRTQFFCIARLLGKDPQKIGNLLPDIGGVAGQSPVGLCRRFGPAIPITKNETRRPTIVR
jgi:hypothetical protein